MLADFSRFWTDFHTQSPTQKSDYFGDLKLTSDPHLPYAIIQYHKRNIGTSFTCLHIIKIPGHNEDVAFIYPEADRMETNYFSKVSNLVSVSFRPDHSFIDDDKGH